MISIMSIFLILLVCIVDDSVAFTSRKPKMTFPPVINSCSPTSCVNGGRCHDGAYCICLHGFTGYQCQTNINECASNPCAHGGICIDGDNSYTCKCHTDYTGPTCLTKKDIDSCASVPCANGGLCVDGVHQYTCKCSSGFTGPHCTKDMDECHSNPCANGGICINHKNSYKCNCAHGFSGVQCTENMDGCHSDPCANGGICINRRNSYKCNCAHGFHGAQCTEEFNACLSNPCLNDGTCTQLHTTAYKCECRDHWNGTNCEIDVCKELGCVNGWCKMPYYPYHYCLCWKGFTGSRCEKKYKMLENRECGKGTRVVGDTFHPKELWRCENACWKKERCVAFTLAKFKKPDSWGRTAVCYRKGTADPQPYMNTTLYESSICGILEWRI